MMLRVVVLALLLVLTVGTTSARGALQHGNDGDVDVARENMGASDVEVATPAELPLTEDEADGFHKLGQTTDLNGLPIAPSFRTHPVYSRYLHGAGLGTGLAGGYLGDEQERVSLQSLHDDTKSRIREAAGLRQENADLARETRQARVGGDSVGIEAGGDDGTLRYPIQPTAICGSQVGYTSGQLYCLSAFGAINSNTVNVTIPFGVVGQSFMYLDNTEISGIGPDAVGVSVFVPGDNGVAACVVWPCEAHTSIHLKWKLTTWVQAGNITLTADIHRDFKTGCTTQCDL
jgi:hypothetical protein